MRISSWYPSGRDSGRMVVLCSRMMEIRIAGRPGTVELAMVRLNMAVGRHGK